MRIFYAIIAFALATAGLVWASLYAILIGFFLFTQRGGGWRLAFAELSQQLDLRRLAVAGVALALGLAFLMLGMALLRNKPPA